LLTCYLPESWSLYPHPSLSILFLSLYGSGLWTLSCPALRNIEVAFNKILHRIWSLPACNHTRIVHLVANLCSLFNVIYCHSNSLLHAAAHCPSVLVQTIFCDSFLSCFSFCGYNNKFGDHHLKQYFVEDHTCAVVVRSLHLHSSSDHVCENIIYVIWTMCCD